MLLKVIRFPFASRFTSSQLGTTSQSVKRYNEVEIKTHFFISNYNSCSYFALPLPLNVGTTQRSDYSSWSRGQAAALYLQPKPPKTLKFLTAGV